MTQHKLVLLLSRQEIGEVVRRLAAEIDRDYAGRELLLVVILRGAFVFAADLVREMRTPVRVDFVRISSYPTGTVTTGGPRVVTGVRREEVRGRDVLLVEDILDTGLSVDRLLKYLRRMGPASLRVCALLDKPSRRRVDVPLHYRGTTVPDRFLVGYGLDMDQRCRNLSDIYWVQES